MGAGVALFAVTGARADYDAMQDPTAEKGLAEAVFVNASARMNDGMADYWSVGKEASLGGRAASTSKPAKGEIMAIRIYNRVLTADERLLNAKLDAIRFLGEPTPAVPGLMILLR